MFPANNGYDLDWEHGGIVLDGALVQRVHEKLKLGRTCLYKDMVCSTKKHTGTWNLALYVYGNFPLHKVKRNIIASFQKTPMSDNHNYETKW